MSDDIVVELLDLPVVVEIIEGAPITVLLEDDITVELISTGIPGPPGPAGGYTHTQASASALWTIPHNLGYRPAVQAFSAGGVQTIGTLTHLDLNTCTLAFVVPVAGTARCA